MAWCWGTNPRVRLKFILAGCLKMTVNYAVIFRKPAGMSHYKLSRHCGEGGRALKIHMWVGTLTLLALPKLFLFGRG